MEKWLRQFNGDRDTKAALLSYLIGFFEEAIIKRARAKQDVKSLASLADAILELERGFEQLEIDYGIKKEPKPTINEAR